MCSSSGPVTKICVLVPRVVLMKSVLATSRPIVLVSNDMRLASALQQKLLHVRISTANRSSLLWTETVAIGPEVVHSFGKLDN